MSPRRQPMSPRRQPMSPKHLPMSPKHQPMSPRHLKLQLRKILTKHRRLMLRRLQNPNPSQQAPTLTLSARLCWPRWHRSRRSRTCWPPLAVRRLSSRWKQADYNGNGGCSLAELDKLVEEKGWPLSKPTLMRAYKKTTLRDGDGDAWV